MELNNQGLMQVLDKNANKKEHLFQHSIPKYIFRAMLAGLFLTIGTAIAVTVGEKGNHIHPDLGKFLYALTFSFSLLMIVYMDTELGTSNMMYLTTAVSRSVIRIRRAAQILFVCVFFNFVGGTLFSFLIAQTSTFTDLPADHFLFTAVEAKLAKSVGQMFVEGIFANVIVNTAVITSARMKDDAGKLLAILAIIFIFAFLGFEHVIANFSSFSMAFFANGGAVDGMTVASVLKNFIVAFAGNYVGGGLLIGLGYSWLNRGETVYYD